MIFFIIFFYFFSCRYIMNATWFDICCMSSQEFDAYAKKRFTAILLRMVYFLLKIAVHLFYYVLIFSISCKLYEGFLDSIPSGYQRYLILPLIHFILPTFYRNWLWWPINKIVLGN